MTTESETEELLAGLLAPLPEAAPLSPPPVPFSTAELSTMLRVVSEESSRMEATGTPAPLCRDMRALVARVRAHLDESRRRR